LPVKLLNLFVFYHRMRYLHDGKKAKYSLLAPIEVKILMSRGSAYKIVTESGTVLAKKAKYFCSKLIGEPKLKTPNKKRAFKYLESPFLN
jgi:hypothetical protein